MAITKRRFEIPADKYGTPITGLTPRATSVATHVISDLSSNYHIEINTLSSFIRVYAKTKDVYLKWGEDSEDYVTAVDFDEIIPADQYIDLVVPLKANGSEYDHVHLVQSTASATAVIIEK